MEQIKRTIQTQGIDMRNAEYVCTAPQDVRRKRGQCGWTHKQCEACPWCKLKGTTDDNQRNK